MKRWLILLLLLCVSVTALAETPAERLAQLDIIAQNDDRIQDEEYYYYDMPFTVGGCLPASATNAMLALLGTPDTDTVPLVRQFLNAMRKEEYGPAVDLAYLYYTVKSPRSSALAIQALREPVTRFYSYDTVTAITDRSRLLGANSEDTHPLSFVKLTLHQRWGWIAETAAYLCENGHPDARIALCGVSVGTTESDSPMASGYYGHYVAFFLEAEEFCQTGTLYMLDSYPRALPGEPSGEGAAFELAYPFALDADFAINQTYTATRIRPTVVQFSLRDDKLATLQALSQGASERFHLLQQYTQAITTFGDAYLVLYLP